MNPSFSLKSRLLQGVLAAVTMCGMASSAFAIVAGDSGTGINGSGSFQSGTGGEFFFRPTAGPVNNAAYAASTKAQGAGGLASFQTFCLEVGEHIGGNSTTVNYVVNYAAVDGGANHHLPAGGGGDVISVGTAWLYSQFALGSLGNYFTGDRTVNASILQNAIWALEDEIADPTGNMFFNLAVAQFGSAGAQANAAPGAEGVWVLNNTVGTNPGTKKQDMLYFAGRPPTTTNTPVPDGGASLAMLGLSLAGLSLAARFHRKSTAA